MDGPKATMVQAGPIYRRAADDPPKSPATVTRRAADNVRTIVVVMLPFIDSPRMCGPVTRRRAGRSIAATDSNPARPRDDESRRYLHQDANLNVDAELKNILGEILSLGDRAQRFTADTQLLGSLPELDSMAVVSLITTIEERFGVTVDDDEISAETFGTFGSLRAFVDRKLDE